jgi:predicted transcriptional regulator
MRTLWISKRTGRLRTGTRISELRKLFETGITVRAIEEPIQCCAISDPAPEIAQKMHQLDFDVIGVKDSQDGHVIGYINACELVQGRCREYLQAFRVSDLVSDSTPLINVLTLLRDRKRVFILTENNVTGIITRADLQKPPIRILLFGLVSLLEIHLSYLVRRFYPNDSWKEKLSKRRIDDAKAMMEQRTSRNEKMDLVDCLQFCDKRYLATAHPDICRMLHFESSNLGNKLLKDIEKLRDKLAHSQDIVTGTTWERIIDLVGNVEKLIEGSEKYVYETTFA